MLAPAAKYSSMAHANAASARRAMVCPKIGLPRRMTFQISLAPSGRESLAPVHKIDLYPIPLLDPATIPA